MDVVVDERERERTWVYGVWDCNRKSERGDWGQWGKIDKNLIKEIVSNQIKNIFLVRWQHFQHFLWKFYLKQSFEKSREKED